MGDSGRSPDHTAADAKTQDCSVNTLSGAGVVQAVQQRVCARLHPVWQSRNGYA
jgi:hypothetical protein